MTVSNAHLIHSTYKESKLKKFFKKIVRIIVDISTLRVHILSAYKSIVLYVLRNKNIKIQIPTREEFFFLSFKVYGSFQCQMCVRFDNKTLVLLP